MTLPNISSLTIDELRELTSLVTNQMTVLENSAIMNRQEARDAVINAKATLENLLGPVNATPGQTTIRGVLAYGDAVIAANSAQAVPLILRGLEIVTKVITKVVKTA